MNVKFLDKSKLLRFKWEEAILYIPTSIMLFFTILFYLYESHISVGQA